MKHGARSIIEADEHTRANERGGKARRRNPIAVFARYDRRIHRVVIGLSTGIEIAFPPRDVEGLENASPGDLDVIEISPSGLGLHFPKLDADIYLPALLDGVLGSRRWSDGRRSPPESDANRAA